MSLLKFLQKDLLEMKDIAEVTEYFKRLNANHFKIDSSEQIEINIEDILKTAKKKFKITKEEIQLKKNEFYKHCENQKEPYMIINILYNLDEITDMSKVDIVSYFTENSNHDKAKIKASTLEESCDIINEKTNSKENEIGEDSVIDEIEEDVSFTDINEITGNIKVLETNDKNCKKFVNLFLDN
jgi:hypothetical protein